MKSKLITARSEFKLEALDAPNYCKGCKRKFRAGDNAYVRRYLNPNNRSQHITTALCNLENCWQEWDASVFTASHPFDHLAEDYN